jgi:hypothetical protein
VNVSSLPEYGLLLDAITPLGAPRVETSAWDNERWGHTLRTAEWHRLSPALFCHLRQRGQAPAAVVSALERSYLANAARNAFIVAQLRQVVGALSAAGTPVVLLKGAALIEAVYIDPAQREMLDLDLLVPRDRLAEANAIVAALGYESLPAGPDGNSPDAPLAPEAHHAAPLVDREHLVAVELHRHVAIAGEGAGFDIDEVWRRARPSSSGQHLLSSPEDLLLHVCFHFTRNRLGGSSMRRNTGGALAQVCDMARIVERETVDWPALADAARRYRLDARVFVALFAARELGVPVPESALAELRPARFDPRIGRRLVALRVLRDGDHLPVRSMRWMVAPSREALRRGWDADPTATLSLARAYLRRARAHAPLARSALRRPWTIVQDHRLSRQIMALEGDE